MSGSLTPGGAGLPRAKLSANAITDLSNYMEEFCQNAKNVPAEITREFMLIAQLDAKVRELKHKVDEDSNTYSSAKNRNSTDMAELKRQIDTDQKQCLHFSEEKVSSAQLCLDGIQQRLKQLDDDIAGIDEFMLSQPLPGAEDEEEGAPASRGGGANQATRKRKAETREDWLQEGKFVEVEWEGEWWQASIKKIKYKQGGAMSRGAPGGGTQQREVLLSYVGGEADEDEWVAQSTGRLRPPSENFHEAPAETVELEQHLPGHVALPNGLYLPLPMPGVSPGVTPGRGGPAYGHGRY